MGENCELFDDAQLKQCAQSKQNEHNSKSEVLACIREIGEIVKQAGGMNDLFFEFADEHLDYLSKEINIKKHTAATFSAMVNMFTGHSISINQLAGYLKKEYIEVIMLMDEMEELQEKELIQICNDDDDDEFPSYSSHETLSFKLPLRTIEALRKGTFNELSNKKNLTIEEFYSQIENLCEDRVQRHTSYKNTKSKMNTLLQENTHLEMIKKLTRLELKDDDMLILLRFIHYTINVDEPDMSLRHLAALYEHSSHFTNIKRQLKSGNYILIKNNIIENSCGEGFCDTESYRLTNTFKEEFLGDFSDLLNEIPIKGLKLHSTINEKKLFYPAKTQNAIDELASLLKQDNFPAIQKRLSDKGMRTGFACIFSGCPGTGKTETAYQIARLCERDVMQIDISNTKSKWFGDSEKLIKSLFDKYRAAVKKHSVTPILLFNEADAVFSKRRQLDDDFSGPAQTENAIQNIILQEIENLNGILIATTNLLTNMDSAFERRFLYKIEFEKPEIVTRKAIWLSMMPDLGEDDAHALANRYDFSGGQIENIARKVSVHHVLSGNFPSLKNMMRFCDEEIIHKNGARQIGFMAS